MEDIFINNIEQKKMSFTNGLWNEAGLNKPWSLGYVSKLIESKEFKTKEDWEDFYYKSGEDRKNKIAMLSKDDKDMLDCYEQSNKAKSLPTNLQGLNFNYGRSKDEFRKRGEILYSKVLKTGNYLSITLDECVEMVRWRVICDTWNGIVLRERNTIKTLKNMFPNMVFIKTDGDVDCKYAIDYEVYYNDILLCAVQIKPKSYSYSNSHNSTAHKINTYKNQMYKTKTGVDTIYIYSKSNGEIINTDVLKTFDQLFLNKEAI